MSDAHGGSGSFQRGIRRHLAAAGLLWRRNWHRPRQVSMVLPSSRFIGRAMARLLRERPAGPVAELGAGTGAITWRLMEQGIPARDLMCLELDAAFCEHLRRAVPGPRIVCAPAEELSAHWRSSGLPPFGGVVSSLPLRLFAPAVQRRVLDECRATMAPGAPFLQLSFRPTRPVAESILPNGLSFEGMNIVWGNVPPGFICRYRRVI